MQVHKNRNVPTEIVLPHTYCVLPSTKVYNLFRKEVQKVFLVRNTPSYTFRAVMGGKAAKAWSLAGF